MEKKDYEILQNAVKGSCLELTKEHIQFELLNLNRWIKAKTSPQTASSLEVKVGTVLNEVEELFSEAYVAICLGDCDDELRSTLGKALTDIMFNEMKTKNDQTK